MVDYGRAGATKNGTIERIRRTMNDHSIPLHERDRHRHGATGIRPVPAAVPGITSGPGIAARTPGTNHPCRGRCPEGGVSEVVGEMLMIGLVIVLLSVFAAALFNFLPAERDPSISILVSNDTDGNIVLWHKGGDWVRVEDLTVIVGTESASIPFANKTGNFTLLPKKSVFDLGSNITVHTGGLDGDETVKLVTSHTVIFTGRLSV
jgi:FlaG/FlaF family flagellin (archaellin)